MTFCPRLWTRSRPDWVVRRGGGAGGGCTVSAVGVRTAPDPATTERRPATRLARGHASCWWPACAAPGTPTSHGVAPCPAELHTAMRAELSLLALTDPAGRKPTFHLFLTSTARRDGPLAGTRLKQAPGSKARGCDTTQLNHPSMAAGAKKGLSHQSGSPLSAPLSTHPSIVQPQSRLVQASNRASTPAHPHCPPSALALPLSLFSRIRTPAFPGSVPHPPPPLPTLSSLPGFPTRYRTRSLSCILSFLSSTHTRARTHTHTYILARAPFVLYHVFPSSSSASPPPSFIVHARPRPPSSTHSRTVVIRLPATAAAAAAYQPDARRSSASSLFRPVSVVVAREPFRASHFSLRLLGLAVLCPPAAYRAPPWPQRNPPSETRGTRASCPLASFAVAAAAPRRQQRRRVRQSHFALRQHRDIVAFRCARQVLSLPASGSLRPCHPPAHVL